MRMIFIPFAGQCNGCLQIIELPCLKNGCKECGCKEYATLYLKKEEEE